MQHEQRLREELLKAEEAAKAIKIENEKKIKEELAKAMEAAMAMK